MNKWSIEYAGNNANTAADASVELHVGSVDGPLVGTIATPPTGSGWGTYATAAGNLTRTLKGINDLYNVLKGSTDGTHIYIGNFDKAAFQ